MAKSHSRGVYTNPEVRFERSDVEYQGIVYFALALGGGTLVAALAMTWYGAVLMNQPWKRSDMPPAKVDRERSAPPIPLEALDDIAHRQAGKKTGPLMFPPRADEYYTDQRTEIAEGNKAKGILSMAETIDQLVDGKLLPARDRPGQPPQQPNKAAAGRSSEEGNKQ